MRDYHHSQKQKMAGIATNMAQESTYHLQLLVTPGEFGVQVSPRRLDIKVIHGWILDPFRRVRVRGGKIAGEDGALVREREAGIVLLLASAVPLWNEHLVSIPRPQSTCPVHVGRKGRTEHALEFFRHLD